MQIQNFVATSPLPALTAQEMRDEAMDLRLRANQDFEKVMDLFGEATVIKEGIRKFLHVQIKRPRQSPYSISLSEGPQCGRQEEVTIAANSHGIANPLS